MRALVLSLVLEVTGKAAPSAGYWVGIDFVKMAP
jgi:hypothetical protein